MNQTPTILFVGLINQAPTDKKSPLHNMRLTPHLYKNRIKKMRIVSHLMGPGPNLAEK